MRVQRIKDLGAIEARFLELAHTTDVKLTAPVARVFRAVLDRGCEPRARRSRDPQRGDDEVRDDGSIVYELPGRQRFAPRPTALAPIAPGATYAIAPIAPVRYGASPALAALLSIWIARSPGTCTPVASAPRSCGSSSSASAMR